MEKRQCQSCAMPLIKEEFMGTNIDGSRNNVYCINCFENGEYTNPDLCVEEMLDNLVKFMVKSGIKGLYARNMAREILPSLNRWKPKN